MIKYKHTFDTGHWILYKDNKDGTGYFYEDISDYSLYPEYRLIRFFWPQMMKI